MVHFYQLISFCQVFDNDIEFQAAFYCWCAWAVQYLQGGRSCIPTPVCSWHQPWVRTPHLNCNLCFFAVPCCNACLVQPDAISLSGYSCPTAAAAVAAAICSWIKLFWTWICVRKIFYLLMLEILDKCSGISFYLSVTSQWMCFVLQFLQCSNINSWGERELNHACTIFTRQKILF